MIRFKVSQILIHTFFFSIVFLLLIILYQIFSSGFNHFDYNFLLTPPRSAGREGGINSILISTFYILIGNTLITVPIGILISIYIVEFKLLYPKIHKFVRFNLNIITSTPSIVIGLFGHIVFCIKLGFGYSLLSGVLTLSCMTLPLFIKSLCLSLENIGREERLAAQTLHFSMSKTYFKILLPMNKLGILASLTLSMSRVFAESATLMFTSGYSLKIPESIFDSGRTLAIHIYDLTMNIPGGEVNAAKTSFILITIIIIMNAIPHLLFIKKSSKGYSYEQ